MMGVDAMDHSWPRRRRDAVCFRDLHQFAESRELRAEHSSPEWKEPVVNPAFVVTGDEPRLRFFDEPFALELSNVAVEIPRLERNASFGVCDDVLPQPIPVPIPGTEHREHEQLDGFEREEVVRVSIVRAAWRHGSVVAILILSIVSDTATFERVR